MELFKDAFFSKSGMLIGKELNHCFNCAYCRANNGQLLDFTKYMPAELNPEFANIPVLVNLFYGDPTLQVETTMEILNRLEESGHKGHVIIVTKGDMGLIQKVWRPYNLDIHFGISTFGINSNYDGGTTQPVSNYFANNNTYCKNHNKQ